jgi:excisionase family DNA binding protein
MKTEENTKRLLTTEEAARDWGISKKAIYRMVREGKIRPFVGLKSWRFDPADFNGVLKRL